MLAPARLTTLLLCVASILSLPEDAVRFPDSRISPCPQERKFCELIADYPLSERVDQDLIENRLVKEKIFDGRDVRYSELQTRNGGFIPERRACRAVRSQIFPQKAVNTQGIIDEVGLRHGLVVTGTPPQPPQLTYVVDNFNLIYFHYHFIIDILTRRVPIYRQRRPVPTERGDRAVRG